MEPKPRTLSLPEAAIAHVKIDGILRLVAIVSAFTFWYSVAIVLFLLHVAGILPLVINLIRRPGCERSRSCTHSGSSGNLEGF